MGRSIGRSRPRHCFWLNGFKCVKKVLFILRKPPHSGTYVQEMLDIVMTTAAFDQDVSLLLLDTAVFQIKKHQNPSLAGLKDSASIFKALPLYAVDSIYVEGESLLENGLDTDCLEQPVKVIPRQQIAAFFKQFDLILNG